MRNPKHRKLSFDAVDSPNILAFESSASVLKLLACIRSNLKAPFFRLESPQELVFFQLRDAYKGPVSSTVLLLARFISVFVPSHRLNPLNRRRRPARGCAALCAGADGPESIEGGPGAKTTLHHVLFWQDGSSAWARRPSPTSRKRSKELGRWLRQVPGFFQ